MADTTFVDKVTTIATAWLNDINDFFYTLFAGATTAAEARTAIGAAQSSDPNNDLPVVDGGTGASTAGDARTNLGLVIGTDVQAYDAALDSLSGLSDTAYLDEDNMASNSDTQLATQQSIKAYTDTQVATRASKGFVIAMILALQG